MFIGNILNFLVYFVIIFFLEEFEGEGKMIVRDFRLEL